VASVAHPHRLAADDQRLFVLASPGGGGGQILQLPK
jgi:hypothetical protein